MKKYKGTKSVFIKSSVSLNQGVGYLIRFLRRREKMSGEVLAGFLGISQQQISRYELETTELTLKQLCNISAVFNMSIWEFMDIPQAGIVVTRFENKPVSLRDR